MADQEFLTRRQIRDRERIRGSVGASAPADGAATPTMAVPAVAVPADSDGLNTAGTGIVPEPSASIRHGSFWNAEQGAGSIESPTLKPAVSPRKSPLIDEPDPAAFERAVLESNASSITDGTLTPPHFATRRELREWQAAHSVPDNDIPVTSLPTERIEIVPSGHWEEPHGRDEGATRLPASQPAAVPPESAATTDFFVPGIIAADEAVAKDVAPRPQPQPQTHPEETAHSVFALLADEALTEKAAPEMASPEQRLAFQPEPVRHSEISAAWNAAPEPPVRAGQEPVRQPADALPSFEFPAQAITPAALNKAVPDGTATLPSRLDDSRRGFAPRGSSRSIDEGDSAARTALWTSSVSAPGDENTDGASGVIILPDMPSDIDVMAPLDESGGVMLTGTITLPPQVSATGVIPTGFEESDEVDDRGFAVGNANRPVSVSSVVAEATSGRILPQTRSSRRLTIVLSIVAGALVIAAIGMIVYYFVAGGGTR